LDRCQGFAVLPGPPRTLFEQDEEVAEIRGRQPVHCITGIEHLNIGEQFHFDRFVLHGRMPRKSACRLSCVFGPGPAKCIGNGQQRHPIICGSIPAQPVRDGGGHRCQVRPPIRHPSLDVTDEQAEFSTQGFRRRSDLAQRRHAFTWLFPFHRQGNGSLFERVRNGANMREGHRGPRREGSGFVVVPDISKDHGRVLGMAGIQDSSEFFIGVDERIHFID
jgi:hypothetical protein